MQIKQAFTKGDIQFCSRALLAFRQNLKSETFIKRAIQMMETGFQLIYISNDENTEATAIAGFRIFEMLRTGNIIYIDDLFTFTENRGKGYASALLNYIEGIAKEKNIKSIHLDSGFALHPAHRLYLGQGYVLGCHHFVKMIN